MANTIDKYCPNCKEKLKRYDTVKRIVRGKNHSKKLVAIERYKCPKCKTIHRDLSEYVYPFKHYEADIIDGVVEGLIGPDTLGYEDLIAKLHDITVENKSEERKVELKLFDFMVKR